MSGSLEIISTCMPPPHPGDEKALPKEAQYTVQSRGLQGTQQVLWWEKCGLRGDIKP